MIKIKHPIYKFNNKLYSNNYWYQDNGNKIYAGDVDDLIDLLETNNLVITETVYRTPNDDYKYDSPDDLIGDYHEDFGIEIIEDE